MGGTTIIVGQNVWHMWGCANNAVTFGGPSHSKFPIFKPQNLHNQALQQKNKPSVSSFSSKILIDGLKINFYQVVVEISKFAFGALGYPDYSMPPPYVVTSAFFQELKGR